MEDLHGDEFDPDRPDSLPWTRDELEELAREEEE
jgi:hypothetical protein